MNNQHWQKVDEIFQTALEFAPEQRRSFLDEVCSDDPVLRAKVEAMLDADDRGWDLIEKPALEVAAPLLAEEPPQMMPGQMVGRYQIVKLIGRGGMGEVFLARDESLKRLVALKLLPADYSQHKDRIIRFQQEAQSASALNHPNILTIYEIGQIENQQFIATEFVEGETLRERMSRTRLTPNESIDIAIQVGSALASAHQAGIVHRDIKPENIMVRPDGYVKLLDFGLAKLTEHTSDQAQTGSADTTPGLVLGTIKYASPEQLRGEEVDGRSDIFSFGVMLYEMITNRAPFEGPTNSDLIAQILSNEPLSLAEYLPDTPKQLQHIVSKSLSKDKDQRYQTIRDVLSDLRQLKETLDDQSKSRATEFVGNNNFSGIFAGDDRSRLTTEVGTRRTAFSAEFVVNEIKQHKIGATLIFGVLFAVSATVGYLTYVFLREPKNMSSSQNIKVSRVTTTGKATNAAISPDGKYVAYVTVDSEQQTVWIRQIPTSTNIEVISARPAAYWGLSFSPDGNYLYYWGSSQDDPPSLFQIPSLGGVSRKLITGVENTNSGNNPISFSSDGSRFTFVREYPTGESAVVVVNSDGTGEQVLAKRTDNSFFSSAAWSPRGDLIAGVFGTTDAHGRYSGIARIGVTDRLEQPLTSERWQWIGDVAWASDGNNLLITGSRQEGDPIQIWEVNCSSGTARRITTDLNNYSGLSLTTDSRGLVTTLNDKLMHIWTQALSESAETKQITFGTATKDGWNGIGWTSDNRIVYSSTANGSQDIWIMDADGRNQRQLTVNWGSDRFGLSVSPDDRYVVFVSDRDGNQHIWRVSINDGSLKQLTSGSGESDPFFSPDGQWVSYHGSTVQRVPVDGGTPVVVDKQLGDQLSFSPDGKLSAYLTGNAEGNRRKIAIASPGGGEPIKEFDLPPTPPRRIQWTPDSNALTYIANRGRVSNLFNQPIDGGTPRQLTDFNSFFIHSFAWSRDGKQLAMARWTVTSDIVLMKDFR